MFQTSRSSSQNSLNNDGADSTLFKVAQVSFLWTGKFTSICRIFSSYRPDYIFRSIDGFIYVYLTDLICTVYLCLFSSSFFCAPNIFHLFVGICRCCCVICISRGGHAAGLDCQNLTQRSQSWLFRQQFGSDSACHFLLRMLNFDRIRGMQSGRIRPALLCNLCFQNACFCSVPTSEGSKSGFSSAAISYSKRAGEEKQ